MGRGAEAQAVLADFQKRAGRDFYYLLASAYVQGLSGDRRAALDDLWQAQLSSPDLGKLSVLAGVRQFPIRVKCATLPWHALRAAAESHSEVVSTE